MKRIQNALLNLVALAALDDAEESILSCLNDAKADANWPIGEDLTETKTPTENQFELVKVLGQIFRTDNNNVFGRDEYSTMFNKIIDQPTKVLNDLNRDVKTSDGVEVEPPSPTPVDLPDGPPVQSPVTSNVTQAVKGLVTSENMHG